MPRRVSRRCVPRSNGATTCSRPTSSACSRGSPCSPAAAPWKRPRPSAAPSWTCCSRSSTRASSATSEERFWMLETIREFALERLEETGGAEDLRQRYSAHFLELAELARPELLARSSSIWFDRIEAEHDNIRAVLGDALEHGRTDVALRIASADQAFLVDARLLERGPPLARVRACSRRGERPTAPHRAALGRRSACHLARGRRPGQRRGGGDARSCRRARSDRAGAVAMGGSSPARATTGISAAAALRGVGRACARAGDPRSLSIAVNNLGNVVLNRGDHERALELFEESLAIGRERHDRELCRARARESRPDHLDARRPSRRRELLRDGLAAAREIGMWTSSSGGSPLSGWCTHARIRHAPRACSAARTRCARKRRPATTTLREACSRRDGSRATGEARRRRLRSGVRGRPRTHARGRADARPRRVTGLYMPIA